jgi:3-hydroxyisobutyryl-CoA hydrolase
MSMATAFCGPKRASDDFITGVTHVLITKIRDKRAAWEAELDSPTLTSSAITKRFFTPGADVKKLVFHPSTGSTETTSRDSTYGRFREWGLPELHWVMGLVTGAVKDTGAFAVTEEELVERVLGMKGESKTGGRGQGMERIARELVAKYCEKDANGYLRWTKAKF